MKVAFKNHLVTLIKSKPVHSLATLTISLLPRRREPPAAPRFNGSTCKAPAKILAAGRSVCSQQDVEPTSRRLSNWRKRCVTGLEIELRSCRPTLSIMDALFTLWHQNVPRRGSWDHAAHRNRRKPSEADEETEKFATNNWKCQILERDGVRHLGDLVKG